MRRRKNAPAPAATFDELFARMRAPVEASRAVLEAELAAMPADDRMRPLKEARLRYFDARLKSLDDSAREHRARSNK